MQDVHGDFNPGVSWQKQQSTRRNNQIWEETIKVLHLEHSLIW